MNNHVHVVGDHTGREHPDVVPHAAGRLLTLLPEGGGTREHSHDHDLPGRHSIHRDTVGRARRAERLDTSVAGRYD